MVKPNFITDEDWKTVQSICAKYNVDPFLIAAIGWHETHWGRLGAGKLGWILGFGYFPGSVVKEKYKGLVNQVTGACEMIRKGLKIPITLQSVSDFAVNFWKPGAPTSWARSVFNIYKSISENYSIPSTDTEILDLKERVSFLEYAISFIKTFLEKIAREFPKNE